MLARLGRADVELLSSVQQCDRQSALQALLISERSLSEQINRQLKLAHQPNERGKHRARLSSKSHQSCSGFAPG